MTKLLLRNDKALHFGNDKARLGMTKA